MDLYEELESILALPKKAREVECHEDEAEWGGDLLVHVVGRLIEMAGESTVRSFFGEETPDEERDPSDVGSIIAKSGLIATPSSVVESSKFFENARGLWDEASTEVMMSGSVFSNGIAKPSGLYRLHEKVFDRWCELLRKQYGFTPSEGRNDGTRIELREIVGDVVTSMDDDRKSKTVDREAISSAARLLSSALARTK